MKGALLLLAVLGIASASSCIESTFVGVITGDAGINIGLAIGLTVLAIAFAYAIGSATANQNLTVFAKDEIYHLGVSLLLILSIAGILFFSCQSLAFFLDFVLGPSGLNLITPDGCYTGGESPQTIASCYMKSVTKTTESTVMRMIKESVKNEMDSTLVISIYNPITGGVSIPWTAHKKAYSMQFDMLAMNFALPALVSLQMQRLILTFSTDLLRWLLPVALLLRVFPPSRYLGNVLIAITVALYVIVPTLYALNGAMDAVVFKDCSLYAAVVNDQILGDCNSDTSIWLVGRAFPHAFFLPNLTLALTVTFLGGISKALKVLG